jgi:chromosome segregation ATPase
MKPPNLVRIPLGLGEFFDRLTIWELKAERFATAEHLPQVREHLGILRELEAQLTIEGDLVSRLERLRRELRDTNAALWDAEDEIRDCEQRNDFGERFVRLARSVPRLNDRRSALKAAIDEVFSIPPQDPKEYS